MRWGFPRESQIRAGLLFGFLLGICVAFPHSLAAWGRNAHKLVVNQAIDTLPQDIRGFFESYRAILLLHVIDPLDAVAQVVELLLNLALTGFSNRHDANHRGNSDRDSQNRQEASSLVAKQSPEGRAQ